MKEIKLLHLFPRLLSLYGEYGNLTVLKMELQKAGFSVTVTGYEDGELDADADMLYIGSGTEDNLMEAARRLLPHQRKLADAVGKGKLLLATGNAMTLLGSDVTRKGETVPALGLCGFHTHIDDSRRHLGDVLTDSSFAGAPCMGFVNTSCVYTGIEAPLLKLRLGAKLGNDKESPVDGIHRGSLYGTQLIGPFLAKNPHVLARFAKELTGQDLELDPSSNLCLAYETALRELEKRIP